MIGSNTRDWSIAHRKHRRLFGRWEIQKIHNFRFTCVTVQIIFQVVESHQSEMRARLLQSETGSSRVLLQGFKTLQGNTGAATPRLFTIQLTTDVPLQNMPKANTCLNQIDIPALDIYQLLCDKLSQAVEETCGIAVELNFFFCFRDSEMKIFSLLDVLLYSKIYFNCL